MDVKVQDLGQKLLLKITGHITGAVEAGEIRSILKSHENSEAIEFHIKDALVIPSSLIGLLIKKSLVEGKKITVKVWNKELEDLFYELNLLDYIEVKLENGQF